MPAPRPSLGGTALNPVRPDLVFVNRFFYPDRSATSQILSDLVHGLTDSGFKVSVVCSRQLYDEPLANLPVRERILGANVRRIAATRFGRHGLIGRAIDYVTFYLSSAWVLLRMLKRGNVLIVKTDPPLMSLMALPIALLKQAKIVNWLQDVFPEVASNLGANPLPDRPDRLLRAMRNVSLRRADMNVVIGERMRTHFANLGIPGCKLQVIENWADADAIRPKPCLESRMRINLGLGDRFVVCYSGNLGRAHEFQTLLLAAEELKLERSFVFLIIGNGAKMSELKTSVAHNGLENFCFLGPQPRADLEDSLAAADVHLVSLLPALEGLIVPSKLYGILAAARPTIYIGDSDGEVARVLRDAACGVTVAIGNGAGLAAEIRALRDDPCMQKEMGRRARQLLRESYAFEHALRRWISLPQLSAFVPAVSAVSTTQRRYT